MPTTDFEERSEKKASPNAQRKAQEAASPAADRTFFQAFMTHGMCYIMKVSSIGHWEIGAVVGVLTFTETDVCFAMNRIVKRCRGRIKYRFVEGRVEIWPLPYVRRGKVVTRHFYLSSLITIPKKPPLGSMVVDDTGSFVHGAGSWMMVDDVQITMRSKQYQDGRWVVMATRISFVPSPHLGLQDICVETASRWLNAMLQPPRKQRPRVASLLRKHVFVGAASSLFRFS